MIKTWSANLLALLSLLLGGVFLVVWTLSYWRTDRVILTYSNVTSQAMVIRHEVLTSQRGVLVLKRVVLTSPFPRPIPRNTGSSSDRDWKWLKDPYMPNGPETLGYQSNSRSFGNGGFQYEWQLGIPHALLLVPCLPIPIIVIRRHLRQRRLTAGRCADCGYDMRASPERCPECGKALVAKSG